MKYLTSMVFKGVDTEIYWLDFSHERGRTSSFTYFLAPFDIEYDCCHNGLPPADLAY